ncbi:MAG: Zn-ribbon domain-containing OB-fold protein [Aliihoeflea sp.]|uniref:Zn-ribbon domain-containing OB-fold protein n=1 Tax=Aliihoeflea sp. TaxID=2608088 RepID=UPI004033B745
MYLPTARAKSISEGSAVRAYRCTDCGFEHLYARGFCPRCGKPDLRPFSLSGEGRVAALTVLHRAPTPEYESKVPYVVALVDLDEGFRVMGHAPIDVVPGARVSAVFEASSAAPLSFQPLAKADQ